MTNYYTLRQGVITIGQCAIVENPWVQRLKRDFSFVIMI